MRPLEIALTSLIVLNVLALVVTTLHKFCLPLLILSAAALLLHLFVEGFRLQAAPIYVAFGVLLIVSWWPSGPLRTATALLAAAGACFGLLICYVFPVIAFPKPAGPLAIGTHIFYFTDTSRTEQYAIPSGQPRRIAAQVWYPAASKTGRRSVYRDAKTLTWRSWHLRYVKTHSYEDAPISSAGPKWPIVFFSPSSGGFRSQNTFLTEYLVSNGYIVVGFDHPDTSSRIAFPDGYIAHSLPDTWVNISSRATLAQSEAKTENIMETNVRDMQFVMDAFQNAKSGTPLGRFSEKMDFDHAVAIGHSFGGAAAAELCRIDSRFKTGLNMDGWMFGPVNERGVGKPFLFMVEGYPLAAPDAGPFEDNENGIGRMGDRQFYDAIQMSLTRSGGCAIRLIGGNHGSFSDLVLFRREWPWRRSEDLDPAIAHQVVTQVVKAFLEQYLKGENSEMKVVTSRYARFIETRCFSTAPRM